MKNKFIYIVSLICFFCITIVSYAQDEKVDAINTSEQTKELNEVSNASLLAPKANELSDKYNSLVEKISSFEDFLEASKEKINSDKEIFTSLKDLYTQSIEGKYTQFNKINEIGFKIKEFSSNVDKDIAEYTSKITELNTIKKEWETIKTNWQKYRTDFYKEYNVIRDVFTEANKNIASALSAIAKIEKPLLATQTELASFQSDIKNTLRDIDAALITYNKDILTRTDNSFFSKDFISSINSELLKEAKDLFINSLSQFSLDISQKYIFLVALNFVLAIIIAFFLIRLRKKDNTRDNIEKLTRRPFSSALFISTILVGFYYTADTPNIVKVFLLILVSISGARAVFCFIRNTPRKVFLNILVITFLISRLFVIVNIPEPIVRIYIALVTLLILILSIKYKSESLKAQDSFIGRDTLLNIVALLALTSFVAELAGFSKLSLKIFDSSVRSLFSGILLFLLGILIKEGAYVFLHYSWLSKFRVCRNYSYHILKRFTFLIDVIVVFLIISVVLVSWGVFDSFNKATFDLLALSVTIRGIEISLGKLFLALILFQLILFISWISQRILEEEVYPRKKVQYGVQSSINRIINYAFICLGVVVALSALGFNLQNLAVAFGVLGVGIGFGLQNIVNNFASGLILLFERPIKVGDVVEIGSQKGTVRKIGLRATIVELFDKTEVIVPNSEIASTKVTNLTLSSRNIRTTMSVSVAYGSDIDKVIRVLLEIVNSKDTIFKDPKPVVAFAEFGESSLNFDLRFWSLFDDVLVLKDIINQEIYKRFAEEEIEIPYNKLDVYFPSLNDSILEHLKKDNKTK